MAPAEGAPVEVGVCIVTYERPEYLRRCLASLSALDRPPRDVVVVDSSAQADTTLAADCDLPVRYVWTPRLAGWMTRARNEALRWVDGEIIAFIDDDVVVAPRWIAALQRAYADPRVAAVAGRTRNGVPGEESYAGPVGRYLDDGRLTEGFAVDTGEPFEVDHGIGANMSFRRDILIELGGFRDDYPGTALREDTDMFLRVRALGGIVLFVPDAVVDHLPAPHVKGRRFDTRYRLYGRRNHLVLLARHRGLAAPDLRRYLAADLREAGDSGSPGRFVQRLGVRLVGLSWGLAAAVRAAGWRPTPARRQGEQADGIRRALSARRRMSPTDTGRADR